MFKRLLHANAHLITNSLNNSLVVLTLSLLRICLGHNLHHILILQLVIDSTPLRGMLGRLTPNHGNVEITKHLCRHILTETFDARTLTNCRQYNWFSQIRMLPLTLCVDSRQAEVFPYHRFKGIILVWSTHVVAFGNATNQRMRHSGQLIHFLNCYCINFVVKVAEELCFVALKGSVGIKYNMSKNNTRVSKRDKTKDALLPAWLVHTISHNNIHQLINRNIFTSQQICRCDAIFPHDLRSQLFRLTKL